jgi:hypothetical protein
MARNKNSSKPRTSWKWSKSFWIEALHFMKLFQIVLGKYLSSCSNWITCLTIIVDKLLNHVCVMLFFSN